MRPECKACEFRQDVPHVPEGRCAWGDFVRGAQRLILYWWMRGKQALHEVPCAPTELPERSPPISTTVSINSLHARWGNYFQYDPSKALDHIIACCRSLCSIEREIWSRRSWWDHEEPACNSWLAIGAGSKENDA